MIVRGVVRDTGRWLNRNSSSRPGAIAVSSTDVLRLRSRAEPRRGAIPHRSASPSIRSILLIGVVVCQYASISERTPPALMVQ